MQYLRNEQSDFDPVFFYLFVFSSSVTYVKTEKMVLREFDKRLVDMIIYTLVNNISRDKKDTINPPCP